MAGTEPRPNVQAAGTTLAAAPSAEAAELPGTDQGLGVWVVEGLGGRMLGILRGPDRGATSMASGVGPVHAPAVAATVVAQGKARDVVTNAATVGQLLSAMGMRPDPGDRVIPPLQTPLPIAPRIVFHSVAVRSLAVETPLPYSIDTLTSATLAPGEVRILRAGVTGDTLVRYRLRFVDGAPVSRVPMAQTVLLSPVDEIRTVGPTSAVGLAASTPSSAQSTATPSTHRVPTPSASTYGTHGMTGQATWYHAPSHAMTAASPWLPFGSNVTVTNLASGKSVTVVINDRGPFGGRLIDLSEYAFSRIAPLGQGVCLVRIAW